MTHDFSSSQTPQDLKLLNYYYNMALTPILFTGYVARMQQRDPETVDLAHTLIYQARDYDIRQTCNLVQTPFNTAWPRDFINPPDCTDPAITGQGWADDAARPLTPDEDWNAGRRALNIHHAYTLDGHGLPQNPYFNYGVTGRGTIGRFGPNHAVDDGIISIRPNADGEPTLHALGIIRKDNGRPALCGGFTEFHDPRHYTRRDVVDTQTQEFFEELVSGSVELLPAYAEGLDDTIDAALRNRTQHQNSALTECQTDTIRQQTITHRKLEQVKHEDPGFLENIRSLFENAQDCYKGPVLNSARNTNNAWMETRLSCITLGEATWNTVKGDDKFNYDFKAGDDAQQVLWHEITPQLIATATGSHDAFFTYLLSSYLLTAPHDDPAVLQSVQRQASRLSAFYAAKAVTPPTV